MLRHRKGLNEARLDLAMDVVIVWPKVERDQVLVRDQKDAILSEAVAIVLSQVTRVEQLFVLVKSLPHIQRLLVDA